MRLPVQFIGSDYEIGKPDIDTILNVYEKAQDNKYPQALLLIVQSAVKSIDGNKPDIDSFKKMPLVNAEIIAIESFKQLDLETKMEGLYYCPRSGCNNQIIQELTKDGDTRTDIAELKINYAENDLSFSLKLDNPIVIRMFDVALGKEREMVSVSELKFRDITLEDLILINTDLTLKTGTSKIKKLAMLTLCDAVFESIDEMDFPKLKNRYMYDLLKFDDPKYFQLISEGQRRYGLNPYIHLVCPECGKEWDTPLDFTSFFYSALASRLRSQSRA